MVLHTNRLAPYAGKNEIDIEGKKNEIPRANAVAVEDQRTLFIKFLALFRFSSTRQIHLVSTAP